MFLHIGQLKKLMANSFKRSGLIVGRSDGGLIVCDGYFGFKLDENYIPKKLKGALAELIGDLPEEGEIYNYTMDGQQAEMDLGRFDFYKGWEQAKEYVMITPVLYHDWLTDFSLYQIHSTGKIRAINRAYTDLISEKCLDPSVENMPGRPSCHGSGDALYWKNDIMVYMACGTKVKEEIQKSLFQSLEELRFTERGIETGDTGGGEGTQAPVPYR